MNKKESLIMNIFGSQLAYNHMIYDIGLKIRFLSCRSNGNGASNGGLAWRWSTTVDI